MMNLKEFEQLPPNAIIARGETTNSPDGIYMVDSNKGRELKWIAKKGTGDDWAIYTYWKFHDGIKIETTDIFILQHGEKVRDRKNISRLVPCEKEVLHRYRD